MTENELKQLKALIKKRFVVATPKPLSKYALSKEIESQKLRQLSAYSKKLRTAADIPNEKGDLT